MSSPELNRALELVKRTVRGLLAYDAANRTAIVSVMGTRRDVSDRVPLAAWLE